VPASGGAEDNRVDEQDRHGAGYFFKADVELHELVEMEIRELLSKYDYDGDNTAVVKGSALAASNGSDPELGEKKVRF